MDRVIVVAECRVVYNAAGRCQGATVKLFENFTDFFAFMQIDAQTPPLTSGQYEFLRRAHGVTLAELQARPPLDQKMEFLVHCGLAEALVWAYFFEDDDRHKKNFAIVHDPVALTYRVVLIDFDRAGFSVLGQVRPGAERHRAPLPAKDAYNITLRDLDNFPQIVDQQPWYWPTSERSLVAEHGYSSVEAEAFAKLNSHPEFCRRQWAAFARIVLTPDAAFKEDCKHHFRDSNYCRRLYRHVYHRKGQLLHELIKSEKFQQWWDQNRQTGALSEILGRMAGDNRLLSFPSNTRKVETLSWNLSLMCAKFSLTRCAFRLLDLVGEAGDTTQIGKALSGIQQRLFACYGALDIPALGEMAEKPFSIVKIRELRDLIVRSYRQIKKLFAEHEVLSMPTYNGVCEDFVAALTKLAQCDPSFDLKRATVVELAVVAKASGGDGFVAVSRHVSTGEQRMSELIKRVSNWMLDAGNKQVFREIFENQRRAYQAFLGAEKANTAGTVGNKLYSLFNYYAYRRRPLAQIDELYSAFVAKGDDKIGRVQQLIRLFDHKEWDVRSFNFKLLNSVLLMQLQGIKAANAVGIGSRAAADLQSGAQFKDEATAKLGVQLLSELRSKCSALQAESLGLMDEGYSVDSDAEEDGWSLVAPRRRSSSCR